MAIWNSLFDRFKTRRGRVIGDGHFELLIVGESNYQTEIAKLTAGKTRKGVKMRCAALLVPEPKNPYDPNAVIIFIRGFKVGYLSRDHCRQFNTALKSAGFDQGVCEAVIVGGWDDGAGDAGHFGVKLNAALPFALDV